MEAAHRAKILSVFVRLKEVLDASFYAVGNVFQPFFVGLLFILSHRLLLSKLVVGTLEMGKKICLRMGTRRTHTEALTLFLTEIQTVDGLCSVIGHDERCIVGLAGFLRENTLNRDFAVFEQGCHHLLG